MYANIISNLYTQAFVSTVNEWTHPNHFTFILIHYTHVYHSTPVYIWLAWSYKCKCIPKVHGATCQGDIHIDGKTRGFPRENCWRHHTNLSSTTGPISELMTNSCFVFLFGGLLVDTEHCRPVTSNSRKVLHSTLPFFLLLNPCL